MGALGVLAKAGLVNQTKKGRGMVAPGGSHERNRQIRRCGWGGGVLQELLGESHQELALACDYGLLPRTGTLMKG